MATSRKTKVIGDGTRIGKVQIQAWVTKDFRQRLKIHAARMDTTVEQLVTEALERLLAS
jgi:predicted GTPase